MWQLSIEPRYVRQENWEVHYSSAFLNADNFALPGNIWQFLSQLGMGDRENSATGIYWVEARVASKQPSMHRRVPHNKEASSQDANSAEVEKFCFTVPLLGWVGGCVCVSAGAGNLGSDQQYCYHPPNTRICSDSQIAHTAPFFPFLLGRLSTTAYPVCLAKCWQWSRWSSWLQSCSLLVSSWVSGGLWKFEC